MFRVDRETRTVNIAKDFRLIVSKPLFFLGKIVLRKPRHSLDDIARNCKYS